MNHSRLRVVDSAAPQTNTPGTRIDRRWQAITFRVAATLGALRAAARAGMARSVGACELLCDQIETALDDDPATACLLLECVAREPASRILCSRLFAVASHLAKGRNPFIVYRACVLLRALGRHDLRLDNHAGLTIGKIRARARPVLARRLDRLVGHEG